MSGFGDPVQYSVFRYELSPSEKQALGEVLWDILNFDADRVMLVALDWVGARVDECLEFWGDPRERTGNRAAVIEWSGDAKIPGIARGRKSLIG